MTRDVTMRSTWSGLRLFSRADYRFFFSSSMSPCFSLVYFSLGVVISLIFLRLKDAYLGPPESEAPLVQRREVGVFQMFPPSMHLEMQRHVSPEFDVSTSSKKIETTSNTIEAFSSIQAAKEMIASGKMDKAQRLFEHALALAPNSPDILNYYGEFLESTKADIVEADHHYLKALIRSPGHSAALVNLGRISALVEEMDNSVLRRIDGKRDTVSRIPETNAALMKAKREAYYQHIYHTVGIEGNTMTLSQTRTIVETRMAVGGKSIAEHNEILGLDAALKYINTTLIHRIGRLTIEDILELHKRVLGFADPTEGGAFRRTQVFVGDHVPPAPSSIPPLMSEFKEWLNSWKSMTLHPVRYAALAHYKLVHIHPFHDGNGRTSRLLMNMILMNAGYPPVIILKQDRLRYYQVLEAANEGDVRPFMRFIAECTERTLDLFLWSTSEYSSEVSAIEPVPEIVGSHHSCYKQITPDT
ncbi:adenosine monophosphate-protein transferase FICD homolog isoform X2 [Cimex lectularius]|uniref:Protein adenylyltransferase Fic n=1 Tax=Cimex lectularius TaxID=79782 RepID=A0A8I6SAC6_CIMLE|nr:adenosine monophosphate-protein transferase FICD homolog isoform X2 [Cimex lectularius]